MPRKVERRMNGNEANERRSFGVVLGQVLQELRIANKMSLLELAKRSRISESTICRYEYGSRIDIPLNKITVKDVEIINKKIRVPDLFTAYKLAAVLGVTLDQLMERCVHVVEEARLESQRNQDAG